MIKFTNFPPEAGDIEFANGSGMTQEEFDRFGKLAHAAYEDTGCVVGHVLAANMLNPTYDRVMDASRQLLDSYPMSDNRSVVHFFMRGVLNARFARPTEEALNV